MTDKEYADKAHEIAERMAGLLADIVDGCDPEDWYGLMREADNAVDDWREFSTIYGVNP